MEHLPVGEYLQVLTSACVPQKRNANKMSSRQFDLLKLAIKKFGFTQPVLVTSDDRQNFTIIDGEHRWKAAKELGVQSIPAVLVKSPESIEEQQLSMNKNRGEPDLALVADIIADLSMDTPLADLTTTGYSEAELRDLLAAANKATTEATAASVMDAAKKAAKDAKVSVHTLEIPFDSAENLRTARKLLKRQAPNGDLGAALLRLLGEDL